MAGEKRGVNKAGLYVRSFQPRIPAENRRLVIAGSQHVEDMLDGKAVTTDDGFTSKDFRIKGDSSNELFLFHQGIVAERPIRSKT